MKSRELLGKARKHWRVTLLTVLLVLSVFLLFAPLQGLQPDDPQANGDLAEDDPFIEQDRGSSITNLQWGLELSGGTSVRAPIHGLTAEDLDIQPDDTGELRREIADTLGIREVDVSAYPGEVEGQGAIETTEQNVTREAFLAAMQEAGIDVEDDDIRTGVHSQTRASMQDVIQDRIDSVGLGGANVDILSRTTGERLVTVDVPNVGQQEVLDIISERGEVEVIAHFPNGSAYRNETVLVQDNFGGVSPAESGEGANQPYVPVVVESGYAQQFSDDMVEYGFGVEGGTSCAWDPDEGRPDDPGHCLVTVVDGEVIYAGGVSSRLADGFRTSDFASSPDFRMETTEFDEARDLSVNLRSGALPAELNVDAGTVFFLEPSMAEEFRYLSLIVAIFAAIGVAAMVYWRYRDLRVAAPMLVTASAEVIILLAFAVIVPIPLDLAHIAGFIAVLGTGVDDLVIIADEIMQRGDIRTDRVFESRFRKAFWVIGVAAATTILAMTPLVALSLGELTGFAIVTIIGVLIGVLITRPAYGNILRILMLD